MIYRKQMLKAFFFQRDIILELDVSQIVYLNNLGRTLEEALPISFTNGEILLITTLPTFIIHRFLDNKQMGPYRSGPLCETFSTSIQKQPHPYAIVGANRRQKESEGTRLIGKERILNFREVFSYIYFYPGIAREYCIVFEEEQKLYFLALSKNNEVEIDDEPKICENKRRFLLTTRVNSEVFS